MVLDFDICKVQHHLVPAFGVALAGDLHRPLGVREIQTALTADHLGFDPDAELKTQCAHLVADAFDAARELRRIGEPVTQGCRIVVTLAEPSVVHDKEFYSHLLGLAGQAHKLALAYLEVGCLPGVQKNGPKSVLPRTAQDMLRHEVVHLPAHSVISRGGICHDRFRGQEGLSFRKFPFERSRVDSREEPYLAVRALLDRLVVIAAVYEIEAVDVAVVFRAAAR